MQLLGRLSLVPGFASTLAVTSLDYQESLSRTSNAPRSCFKLQQNGDKVTQNGSFTRVYVSL